MYFNIVLPAVIDTGFQLGEGMRHISQGGLA